MARKPLPHLAVLFSTVEDMHSEMKAQVVDIPDSAVIWLRIGNKLIRVATTQEGHLDLMSQTQLVVRPRTTNAIEIDVEPY